MSNKSLKFKNILKFISENRNSTLFEDLLKQIFLKIVNEILVSLKFFKTDI